MVDYNFIKNVYNIKFYNKKKSLEQYESFKNISLLNIETCESFINRIEFFENNYDENFDIKCFLKYLKYFNVQKIPGKLYFIPTNIIDNEKFNCKKYNVQRKFFEELENLFRENQKKNYEKEIIKSKQRKIHQEKFMMCIHKLKLSLRLRSPDHLIYEIGTFM